MLIDSHIHVGQFFDRYFAPLDIHNLIDQMHIDYYMVSSTTMCEENYPKVIDEIRALIELDENKVIPIMWITPEGLKGNIAWFLESDIKWRCLKIHPSLHKNDWSPKGKQFAEVISVARDLNVPILIHTGNEDCCQCDRYKPLIANNRDVTFILAHGRPIGQALPILREFSNVYADSAFMSIDDMKILVEDGLSHKLLWGTDMCIPKHFYPEEDMVEYYQRKLNAFKCVCTLEQFKQVTYRNTAKLFGLQTTD